jgi:hypothetical protein
MSMINDDETGKRTRLGCPTLKAKRQAERPSRNSRSASGDETDRRRSIRSYLTLTLPNCFRVQNGIQWPTHRRGRTGFDLRFRPRRHAEDDSLAS